MKIRSLFVLLLASLLVVACNAASANQPVAQQTQAISVSQGPPVNDAQVDILPVTPSIIAGSNRTDPNTPIPALLETQPQEGEASAIPTAAPTLAPEAWKDLPVIPVVGDASARIFERGQALGNNPQAFSKIGDCGSTPTWFLGDFDKGERFYRLGDYQNLQAVIDQFQGSYGRTSLSARAGFNASSVFAPLWTNSKKCEANEAPLACEYRLHRPVIAFIMLGTNDVWHLDVFETQMRQIIDFSIEQGVIPILTTKADNREGDHSINATIARLAVEYDLPLWNYWLAAQSLPNQGLQEDEAHLTWAPNRFDDPDAMESAWTTRNLTALQTLDAVWRRIEPEQ